MNSMKPFFLIISVFISVLACTATAAPIIGIGSMYDVLTPGMQSMTKRIYNTGVTTAFVRVDLFEIHPNNDAKAKESPQQEITGNTLEQNRLIVTPLRMIIPPSGFQAVRILWPGDRSEERYYRVRFTPVMPEINDEFGLNDKTVEKYKSDTLKAGINVLAGYGSIVIVQPDNAVFNSVFDNANANFILVKNNGNTTISLDNIGYCKPNSNDCGNVTREFVLPGRNKRIAKKAGYQTKFILIEGNNKRALVY